MEFSKKHAIVTGGVHGIGRRTAEAFLREGANVTVIDIDQNAGERLANRFEKLCFFHGDIAEKDVLEKFVSFLKEPADFLVNNACINRGGLLSECSYDEFEYVQRIGVTAPFYLTSLLSKSNLFCKNAAIVNIASTRAFQSQQDTESYSAAKGGIVALTHAMAVSLSGSVRVNSVSPGWIEPAPYLEYFEPAEHSEQDMLQHPVGRGHPPDDVIAQPGYRAVQALQDLQVLLDGLLDQVVVVPDDGIRGIDLAQCGDVAALQGGEEAHH